MPICYPDSPRRCRQCERLIAARAERERAYLAALGNLTAAVAAPESDYLALQALVHQAELELELAEREINQHQAHALAV